MVEIEVDHVTPVTAGGPTTADNLCLTCVGCNGFKLAYRAGTDPKTGAETTLFHPRLDRWDEHFAWSADGSLIQGLTPTGRATVARLRMNRPRMVEARQLWVQGGWHPPPS